MLQKVFIKVLEISLPSSLKMGALPAKAVLYENLVLDFGYCWDSYNQSKAVESYGSASTCCGIVGSFQNWFMSLKLAMNHATNRDLSPTRCHYQSKV
jgi:hypothetical protein